MNFPRFLFIYFFIAVCSALKAEPPALFDSAYQLEVQGKYKEAMRQYESVLGSLSNRELWPKASFRTAECLWQLKRFQEAADRWESLAKNFPSDPLAPEALWMALTTRSGPLKNIKNAIQVTQLLQHEYPDTEYGERAAYAEGVLFYWSNKKSAAKNALKDYLQKYRDGKFTQAAKDVLTKMETSPTSQKPPIKRRQT